MGAPAGGSSLSQHSMHRVFPPQVELCGLLLLVIGLVFNLFHANITEVDASESLHGESSASPVLSIAVGLLLVSQVLGSPQLYGLW